MKKLLIVLFTALLFVSCGSVSIKPDTLYVEGLDITADITGKKVYDAGVIKYKDGTDRIVFTYSKADDGKFFCYDGLTDEEQQALYHDPDIYYYLPSDFQEFNSLPKLYISENREHYATLSCGTYADELCMFIYVDRAGQFQGRYIGNFQFYKDLWILQGEDYNNNILIMKYLGDGTYIMPSMKTFASKLECTDDSYKFEASDISDYKLMPVEKGNDYSESRVRIGKKTYNGFGSNGYVFYWK